MSNNHSRRDFIRKTSLTGVSAFLGFNAVHANWNIETGKAAIPAIAGGDPVRTKPWPQWPMWNKKTDEKKLLEVLRSGKWSRGAVVNEFEKTWAETIGAKRALTTVNGTNALITAISQLDIGAGDEVILPPYTFIACLISITANGAMPVFADIDPETFQINPDKIEEKITANTRAIMPVHICGLPADMPRIMAIAKKHNLLVIEDACQAWLAEINNRKVGTFGNAGCFSFQNSKNIPIGEGGAIVSNDDAFMDRCYSFHNLGLKYGTAGARSGSKLRMTEYQAAIGLAQLKRLDEQTTLRNSNAAYLQSQLKEIPGIVPYKLYDHVTRAAFHLFPFHYKKEFFDDLTKDDFMKALRAEGIPCSGGYAPLNTLDFLGNTFQTKNYRKMYTAEQLNEQQWLGKNRCPANEQVCKEAIWFSQNMLLGNMQDMEDIVDAIEKIRKNAGNLKSKSLN